jgi:serine/threonine-protein kinase
MIIKLFDSDIKCVPGQYFEGFKIVKIVGEGRHGICYLITDDKNLYILKQLKKKAYQENPMKMQYEEEILKVLKHEAIPRYIRKIENDHFTGYVLEYKQGTTFEAMIFNQRHVFTRNDIHHIGRQLIDILHYLHGKGVVHRDIRVPNTLYHDHHIYLVDFGLARWIDNKKYKADIDFSYFGDFLIHLYYTSFIDKPRKSKPWYEELILSSKELVFLKKLMGIEKRYKNINEVEVDFEEIFTDFCVKE